MFETTADLQGPPKKQRVVIRYGEENVIVLYDINNFLLLTLADTRTLWKPLFQYPWKNEAVFAEIKEWLPAAIAETKAQICAQNETAQEIARETERLRREVSAFGSVVTQKQKLAYAKAKRTLSYAKQDVKASEQRLGRAEKLQIIFTEKCRKYKIF
jgi:hypothetical protein